MMIDIEITHKKYANFVPLLALSFSSLIVAFLFSFSYQPTFLIKYPNLISFSNNWESSIMKLTQISIIGDYFYTNYFIFIYILSIILLLAMIGAILLTNILGKTKEISYLKYSFFVIIISEFHTQEEISLLKAIFGIYSIIHICNFMWKLLSKIFKKNKNKNKNLDYLVSAAAGTPNNNDNNSHKMELDFINNDNNEGSNNQSNNNVTPNNNDNNSHKMELDFILNDNNEGSNNQSNNNVTPNNEPNNQSNQPADSNQPPEPNQPAQPAEPNQPADSNQPGGEIIQEIDPGVTPGYVDNDVWNAACIIYDIFKTINEGSLSAGPQLCIGLGLLNLIELAPKSNSTLEWMLAHISSNWDSGAYIYEYSTPNSVSINISVPYIEFLQLMEIGFYLMIICLLLLSISGTILVLSLLNYKKIKSNILYPYNIIKNWISKIKGNKNTKKKSIFLLPLSVPLDLVWSNFETYFYIIFILALLLWVINILFSIRNLDMDKGRGFECGLQSFFQTREQFHISFHRVSLLFLAFDLEIVIIYPASVSNIHKVSNLFFNLLAFLIILMLGFIYEISVNALDIFVSNLVYYWNK
jgi:NADH:ubiquinone oxidoreductase subunit 3 (subunit A)